jgi:hypothetical protein
MELIFEIRDADEGGLYARALGHGIFRGRTDASGQHRVDLEVTLTKLRAA